MLDYSFFILFSLFVAIPEKLFKLLSIRKDNLKFYKHTFTKDTHQILKNEIFVSESLSNRF